MKLLLLKPNMGRLAEGPYVDEGRMEPLQLGVLAALTPRGVEVRLADDRCEAVPVDEPFDLVAITVETFTARRAYALADAYRARGVPVVLGGFHPTLAPDEAAAHADALVLGDAESVWGTVIADAQAGCLKPRYTGNGEAPQAGIRPRRDLFRGKGYLPITLLQFGRGCSHACSYCAIARFFRQTYRTRAVEDVVREIEAQERRLLFFVDDNIVADHHRAKALFRALKPLSIRWVSQASVDMAEDRALMDMMAESGCAGLVVGFETLSEAALAGWGKAPNLAAGEQYGKVIEALKSRGLLIWGAFLLGHDEETPESLKATLAFAEHHRFTFAAFNMLAPYPGTPVYEQLRKEGRLLYGGRWWLHPDYRFNAAPFVPKHMAADELTEAVLDLRRQWNSAVSQVRRFFEPRIHLNSLFNAAAYWRYNPLFRRETFKKHGMRLGGR